MFVSVVSMHTESGSDAGLDEAANISLPDLAGPTTPTSSPAASVSGASNINKFRGKRCTGDVDMKELMASFAATEESAQERFLQIHTSSGFCCLWLSINAYCSDLAMTDFQFCW